MMLKPTLKPIGEIPQALYRQPSEPWTPIQRCNGQGYDNHSKLLVFCPYQYKPDLGKASGKVDTETGKMLTYAENNMSSVARVFLQLDELLTEIFLVFILSAKCNE